MPPDPSGGVQHLLRDRESVLWEGKPVQARYVTRLWPMSLFGALFLAFSVFWVFMALSATRQAGGPAPGDGLPSIVISVFPFFGLPFVLVGFYLTFGHYIKSAIEWKRMLYVITDQRVILRSGAVTPVIASVDLNEVTGLTVSGTTVGDLVFEMPGAISVPMARKMAHQLRRRGVLVRIAPTLESIANPEEVYRIAEDALQRAKRAGK